LVSEVLRIFWNAERRSIARAIKEIARFEVPAIGTFEDKVVVQRTDLHTEEEVLLLLYHAGDQGLTRRELGRFVLRAPSTITEAIAKLSSSRRREVVKLANSRLRLTDLGARRVFKELGDRLIG
jgi:hypothetical protein